MVALWQYRKLAAIGGKVIARETISAMRKDVTAKCYMLWRRRDAETQAVGQAEEGQGEDARIWEQRSIPQEAFIAALRTGDEG